jgi:universal stress protein A
MEREQFLGIAKRAESDARESGDFRAACGKSPTTRESKGPSLSERLGPEASDRPTERSFTAQILLSTFAEVDMILLNSVLVATDFGDTSEVALNYGRNLARAFGANLHILHVADNVMAHGVEFFPTNLGDVQGEVDEAARKRLNTLLTSDDRTRLNAKAVVRVSAATAEAIVEYAKKAHVDVIVVGTHGRGPVAHLFMGSVAEKVVRTAPCPVLVVRPNEHEFILPDPVGIAARI